MMCEVGEYECRVRVVGICGVACFGTFLSVGIPIPT